MKNKKIIYIVLILFLFLFLTPNNSFAITNVFAKNQLNENVTFALPNSLDNFKYIIIIEVRKDTSYYYRVYWSEQPFSISQVEGDSYYFYSEYGAYWSLYNSTSMNSELIYQHTSYHGQTNFKHKIIFSTFNLADPTGNIIFPKGEYGVDYTNTSNSEDFYEGNSGAIVQGPSNIIDTSETENLIYKTLEDFLNKFNFVFTIKENVEEMVEFIVNINPNPIFTLNLNSKWFTGNVTVLDLSFYKPYKEFGDLIIVAFSYLIFL